MRSLLDMKPVLGSDFPVEPCDPFQGIYAAVTRRNPQTVSRFYIFHCLFCIPPPRHAPVTIVLGLSDQTEFRDALHSPKLTLGVTGAWHG